MRTRAISLKAGVSIAFAVACFLTSTAIQAQQHMRSNFWYFGKNAGIDFNLDGNGIPEPIEGSLNHYECAASISDEEGKLLFYTDGRTVYDKSDTKMRNGENLDGAYSESQVLIVPHPGNSDLYYIFTTGAGASIDHEYSLVNMKLNGGLGDVEPLQKNIPLNMASNMMEQISGIACSNGDIWIITHRMNSKKFLAYKIDTYGLHNAPIESIANLFATSTGPGAIKFSHDGTKIVMNRKRSSGDVVIFDFDSTTGLVSTDPVIITTSLDMIYGVEFSPDNTKLYVAGKDIIQIDLSNNYTQTVFQPSSIDGWAYNLLLGPDGKIYSSTIGNSLNVINYPNRVGVEAEFVQEGFTLLPGTSSGGYSLPNFVQNYTVLPCTSSLVFNSDNQLPDYVTMVSDFIRAGSAYNSGDKNRIKTVKSGSALYTILQAGNYVELGHNFEVKPLARTFFKAFITVSCNSPACNSGTGKRSIEVESTDEESKVIDLHLFPNPLHSSELQLEYTLAEDKPVSIFLYNAVGQEVRRLLDGTRPGAGSYSHSFNVSDLASGIYTCRMQAGEKVINRKLIVQ